MPNRLNPISNIPVLNIPVRHNTEVSSPPFPTDTEYKDQVEERRRRLYDKLFNINFDKLAKFGTLNDEQVQVLVVRVILSRFEEIRAAGINVKFAEFLCHCRKILLKCKELGPATDKILNQIEMMAKKTRSEHLINCERQIERKIKALTVRKFVGLLDQQRTGNAHAFFRLFQYGYIGEKSLRLNLHDVWDLALETRLAECKKQSNFEVGKRDILRELEVCRFFDVEEIFPGFIRFKVENYCHLIPGD